MIETVKIQGQGYLLNGTMSVPMADGNREYEAIKVWLSEGNTPEPEFTDEELSNQELQKKLNEAQTYLNDTDHKMYTDYERKEDETQEVIDYIKEQRSIARAFIRANK